MRRNIKNSLNNQQRGMVLIVCLIMLAVLTVLGVHTMSMASMEGQMSSNSQTMMTTFQTAESAISATLADKPTINEAVQASQNDGKNIDATPPEGATPEEIAEWEAAVEQISINNDYALGKYAAATKTRQLGQDNNLLGSTLNTIKGIPIIIQATAEQPATGARSVVTQAINYMGPEL